MIAKIKNFFKRFSVTHRIGGYILSKLEFIYKDILKRINQLDYKIEYLFWLSQNKNGESTTETKQRVFKTMPHAEDESRAIQLTNNVIMKKLKAECDANGIEFFLLFGTLLGAVRNRGFVPWDDDVDIGMMRRDYEKLVEVLKDNSELQIDNCYSSMYQMFVKVKLKASDKFFIDIFVFDEFEANEENLEARYTEIKSANLKYAGRIKSYLTADGINTSAYNIPRADEKLDAMMTEYYTELKTSLDYYGSGNYICLGIDNPSFTRTECSVYKKNELMPWITVDFEGEKYFAFRNADRWLRNVYGDYWAFPHNMMSGHADLEGMSPRDFEVMAECGVVGVATAAEYAAGKKRFETEFIDY